MSSSDGFMIFFTSLAIPETATGLSSPLVKLQSEYNCTTFCQTRTVTDHLFSGHIRRKVHFFDI